jgi:hypothetical protein
MKYIPEEKEIENMLKNSSPHTSPRLDQQLADAPWTSRAVARRRIYGAALTLIAIMAVSLAATPQGRVLAQSVLQFFTRTESDSYYEPVSDLTFEDTTPFHQECGIPIHPTCSVEQIRSMVDFEVKQIGTPPQGVHFIGSTGGPDFVELKYGYDRMIDGNLSVIVEAVGKPSAIGTGIAAKSAPVEQVQIGNLPAEYYTGVLFQDENGNVTWNPNDPTATLRWEDGDSTYTLTYYSTSFPLSRDELIAVAESMTLEPIAP